MFKLIKNELINTGKCWYEDEYNNTVFIRKNNDNFVARIRFNDKNVVAKPFKVCIPLSEDNFGDTLCVDFHNGDVQEREDIKCGIDGFTTLIQKWIQMLYDFKFLDIKNELLKVANPELNDFEINEEKLRRIRQYEEINGLI